MSTSDQTERRRHLRAGRVAVSYRGADGQAHSAETQNLSAGGAFIITDDPEEQGTQLSIELHGPSGVLTLAAEVRWTSRFRHAPGMGIQWLGDAPGLAELLAGLGA